jgi:hypothetical protein
VNGTDLWDLVSGRFLATIPSGSNNYLPLFEPGAPGALLLNSLSGFYRWPIGEDPAAAGVWRIGPPEKIPIPGSDCLIAQSRDGHVIAVANHNGGIVLCKNTPYEQVALKPHVDARYIAVSPDGRRIATGSHAGTEVKIWNAQTGELEKVLPIIGTSVVAFSPDGKWLGTSWGDCRLWSIDDWRLGPVIGGGSFAFSPDGSILAVEKGNGVVRLVDPKFRAGVRQS